MRILHIDGGCVMSPEDYTYSEGADSVISITDKPVRVECGEQLRACGRAVDCSCHWEPAP